MFKCDKCGNSTYYIYDRWKHLLDDSHACSSLDGNTVIDDGVKPESFTYDELIQIVKVLSLKYKDKARLVKEMREVLKNGDY